MEGVSAEWIRAETRIFSGISKQELVLSSLGRILGSTVGFLCRLLGLLQLQVTVSSLFSWLILSTCRLFNLAILRLSCLRLIALWFWWRPKDRQQATSLAMSKRKPTIAKTINSSRYDEVWSIYLVQIYFDQVTAWGAYLIIWSNPEIIQLRLFDDCYLHQKF